MSKMHSILVALNPFKGTLTNQKACEIVADALKSKYQTTVLPIGDGGRGTLWSVKAALGGETETFECAGPMGKPTKATVLCLPDKTKPHSLYIESAEVCGFHLVAPTNQDVLRASTHGLGELLDLVLKKWGSLKKIYVGLGDSATSDAGMGMLSALGYQFLDNAGRPIWGNANGLRWIERISTPKHPPGSHIEFTVLCDVLNPLCGPDGAALAFAPQKGATKGKLPLVEQGMENFATRVYETLHQNIKHEPMTGAAGGLAAAFRAFFKARLVSGAQFLLDWLNFDERLSEHSLVITGEGKTDAQTLSGKGPYEVIKRADRVGKKAIILSGSLGSGHQDLLKSPSVLGCFEAGNGDKPELALSDKTAEIFSDKIFLEKAEL